MTDNEIKYLLTLPPEQIIHWYQSKGFKFSWNWRDLWQDAHARFFTVAKIMKLDILQAVKDATDDIFKSGLTYEEFRKQLEHKCRDKGIQLIVADRFYPSSKLCSCCGNIKKDLKLSDRIYKCDCGNVIDRDFQASINLKAYGERVAS